MSVKSDRWIRRMAEEQLLIQPFDAALVRETGGRRIISAGASSYAYALGVSVETFRMPRNVTGIAMCKSTYARAGLMLNTTPLEAGWTGRLVIELGNLANLPLRVYVNEGIGQVIFLESDEACDVSYEDRGGKYQGQTGLTYSRL